MYFRVWSKEQKERKRLEGIEGWRKRQKREREKERRKREREKEREREWRDGGEDRRERGRRSEERGRERREREGRIEERERRERGNVARFTICRIAPSSCAVSRPAAKIEMDSILATRQSGTAGQCDIL